MQLDKLSATVLSKEDLLEETEDVASSRNLSSRNSPRIKMKKRNIITE